MAKDRIKGITIEIGGDTTGLRKALSDVDKSIKDTQSELKEVNQLLKLDPKNTELLSQKQTLLKEAISKTAEKLQTLREAEKQVQQQFERGEVSREQYDALKREIIKTEDAEKNLSSELKNTNTALDQHDRSIRNTIISAELWYDVAKKVGSAIVSLAKDAISYNAEMESYTASFASFLGSAEAAEEAIANIKQDASTMPFGSSALIEANQLLITAGVSAEESRENIDALASAVAAVGGGNSELSRMASNLQQIKNTGKATSMDIKQFANAGINIYGLLGDYAESLGLDLEDLEYTYENITNAIKLSVKEGGRYFGAMERQANTYNGQLNQLKAKIQNVFGTTFESVSETLKNEVFPAINEALDSIDWNAFSQAVSNIASALSGLIPVASTTVTTVIGILGNLLKYLTYLTPAWQDVLNDILDLVNNVFKLDFSKALQSIKQLVWDVNYAILNDIVTIINAIIRAVNGVIEFFTGTANRLSYIKIPGTEHGSGRSGSFAATGSEWLNPPAESSSKDFSKTNVNNNDITININGSNADPTAIATEVKKSLTSELRRSYNAG